MKNLLTIFFVASLCIAVFLFSSAQGSVADELWNKYRVKLIELLQGRFSHYHSGLSHFGSNTNIDQTVLHIVTDPVDTSWHTDPSDLAEFAGYVPAWKNSWEARTTTDNTVAEKYKALLFSMSNQAIAAQQFAKFNTAPKGFQESPHHERLGQFIARTQGAPANAFHFIVEEGSGTTSIGGPWGTKTSTFSSMSSIVRGLKATGATVMWDNVNLHHDHSQQREEHASNVYGDDTDEYDEDDDTTEYDEDYDLEEQDDVLSMIYAAQEDQPQAASELFGRRRRRSSPPVVQTPIHISSKKFHMDMKASGLIGIPVAPQFVDRTFIRNYRGHFQGNWFGAGGQFGLMPSIVWVAMRPHVVLRLSESEFRIVQQSWGSSLGLATGGVFFRNSNFRQTVLNDVTNEVLGSLFSDEVLNAMRENNDLQDTATFTIKSTNDEGEEVVLQEGLLEDFHEDLFSQDVAEFRIKNSDEMEMEEEDDILAAQFNDHEDEEYEEIDKVLPASELFGRRRRRRSPPPPPPPPPVIIEKTYEAVFQSNSPLPQVLAITSDIL